MHAAQIMKKKTLSWQVYRTENHRLFISYNISGFVRDFSMIVTQSWAKLFHNLFKNILFSERVRTQIFLLIKFLVSYFFGCLFVFMLTIFYFKYPLRVLFYVFSIRTIFLSVLIFFVIFSAYLVVPLPCSSSVRHFSLSVVPH